MNKKIITSLAAAVSTMAMAGSTALNAFAEGESSAANGQQPGGMSLLSMPLMLIIMFVLLYFMAIRPQKKRDRELKEMQESLQVGDEIVTGGGIVGIVVRTGDDTVVIETGGERQKLRIKTWAITENVTAMERIKAAKASASSKKSEAAGLASAKLVDDEAEEKAEENKSKKNKNKKSSDEEE
jgi:preprotein translocase subunit YajC